MDGKTRSNRIIAVVGKKIPWRCGPCGTEAGYSESLMAVTSVAKWICPKCGTLNEFDVEFRIAAP